MNFQKICFLVTALLPFSSLADYYCRLKDSCVTSAKSDCKITSNSEGALQYEIKLEGSRSFFCKEAVFERDEYWRRVIYYHYYSKTKDFKESRFFTQPLRDPRDLYSAGEEAFRECQEQLNFLNSSSNECS